MFFYSLHIHSSVIYLILYLLKVILLELFLKCCIEGDEQSEKRGEGLKISDLSCTPLSSMENHKRKYRNIINTNMISEFVFNPPTNSRLENSQILMDIFEKDAVSQIKGEISDRVNMLDIEIT